MSLLLKSVDMFVFLKYVSVQIALYVVDYGVFLIYLHFLDNTPVTANIAGKIVAGIAGCIVHRRYTFNISGNKNRSAHYIKYFLGLVLNIPLSSGVLSLLLTVFPYPEPAKFLSDVICLIISFALLKFFIFTKGSQAKVNSGL